MYKSAHYSLYAPPPSDVLPMGPVFGAGEGPVHGYAIQCEGNEPNVLNCTHLKVPLNAINPHVADIGIRCFNLTSKLMVYLTSTPTHFPSTHVQMLLVHLVM